jgi:5-methylcytosine-specific restriction endonuclease McrA
MPDNDLSINDDLRAITCLRGHQYIGSKCVECKREKRHASYLKRRDKFRDKTYASTKAWRDRKKAEKPPKPPKTKCNQGHPWIEGQKYCRPCKRECTRAWKIDHREEVLEAMRIRSATESERARKKQWGIDHPDKVKASHAAWTSRNRDKTRASSAAQHKIRRTFKTWRDRLSAYSRVYYAANRLSCRVRHAAWLKDHPDKPTEYASRRRARKAGNHGDGCTPKEWLAILKKYGNKCADCGVSGKTQKMTRDHIIPISKGGADMPHNIRPLCRPCNSRKNANIAPGTQYSLFTMTAAA